MYKNTIIMWLLVVLSYIYFGCQSDSQSDERSNEEALTAAEESNTLSICSFNIQFLGHFKKKDDTALASILKDYNIEVVQELVAPPRDGNYPDGETYSTDTESVEFFKAMQNLGFEDILSEEDTGTNDEIHTSTSSTEWWATFFKPDKVVIANNLPSGFLADDRSNHDDYERVPSCFLFSYS